MSLAVGIDLGGTKIETQVFDADWQIATRQRVETPDTYDALVDAIVGEIQWGVGEAGARVPVGIGAAGLVSPTSGKALTANLCASGRPLPRDISERLGFEISYINDCRAFTLSEAVFGAGKDHQVVVGLILGTGVGGGVAVDRQLIPGLANIGGEFGHMPVSARLIEQFDLPILSCGCGRKGCYESLISGPGMAQIARHRTGEVIEAPQIAAEKANNPSFAEIWTAWLACVIELMQTICLAVDPQIITLGGGLSKIRDLAPTLETDLRAASWWDYPAPRIVIAQGGDTSGARGAAYHAWRAAQ